MKNLALASALLVLAGSAAVVSAETVFALAGGGIYKFDSATPGAVTTVNSLPSGLGSGFTLRAIDFRPSTKELFAFATKAAVGATPAQGQLYKINTVTGNLTSVGLPVNYPTGGAGIQASIDFNPISDTLRIVNFAPQRNFSMTAAGGLVAFDPNSAVRAVGLAYRADGQAFVYDYDNEEIAAFNGATGAAASVGSSGVFSRTADSGFDISPDTGVAFLSYNKTDATYFPNLGVKLATVNLATGAVTDIGTIGVNAIDIAVLPTPGSLAVLGFAGALVARRRR